MNTEQPRTDESLRKELLALGAREYEVVALTMEPKRGSAALAYAIAKGAEHPISYAIKLFDSPEWHPSGEVHRRGVNRHAEAASLLPSPRPSENLEAAKNLMEEMGWR